MYISHVMRQGMLELERDAQWGARVAELEGEAQDLGADVHLKCEIVSN
jgi:hypothetical protein